MKNKSFKKLIFLLFSATLLVAVIFVSSFFQNSSFSPPPLAKEYAPNIWFDSEENYYPVNPLDFYYDENLNELPGKIAKQNYNNLSLKEKLEKFTVFY